MNSCSDKNMQALLHHYELGLLSEKEQRLLEMHLMECQACFESLQQFQKQASLMKHDPEVRKAVEDAVRGKSRSDLYSDGSPRETGRKIGPRTLIPALILAAAVLTILILKPFQFQIGPNLEAVASENRLAVVYFDNLENPEDPDMLGKILTNLLITDLAESEYIYVLSGQRLYDILKLLGKEESNVVDPDVASAVAQKWNARWLLKGSILQSRPRAIVTAQLIEVSSGLTLAAWKVEGADNEPIFPLADRLSADIRNKLPLPGIARGEADRMVTEVTTHSQEAYLHYLEGLDFTARFNWEKAIESFNKAIEYDSAFAMAYYRLAWLDDQAYVSKALKYIDRVSQKEKHYIKSLHAATQHKYDLALSELKELLKRYPDEKEAMYWLGRYHYDLGLYDDAIPYYRLAIQIDPLYKLAHNELAYAYNGAGRLEEALAANDNYLSLAPDEPNPYDSKGYIYATNGMFEEAERAYRKSLEIDPTFTASAEQLLELKLFARNYDAADSIYKKLIEVETGEAVCELLCMTFPAILATHRGQFDRAFAEIIQVTQDTARMTTVNRIANTYLIAAILHYEKGQIDKAIGNLGDIRRAYTDSVLLQSHMYRHYLIQMLADAGRTDEAKEELRLLKKDLGPLEDLQYCLYYARGALALAEGDYDAAVTNLRKSAEMNDWFNGNFMLARAHLAAGHPQKAIPVFENLSNDISRWRFFWAVWDIKTHYYLGMAYEETGAYEMAARQYQIFIDIWQDADIEISELTRARQRLSRLKAKI